ncbi:MAG TPA: 4a-hydroxytetrahydrobiopterin dehydratase [Verrucomicrobiae bacterium]|nr:4a-hydroxytetrahydrobiopterin dehydratase [Verrucomicrobiae bacterium]
MQSRKPCSELKQFPRVDVRKPFRPRVTLNLTTHDERGITEKDFSLARQCDEVLSRHFVS